MLNKVPLGRKWQQNYYSPQFLYRSLLREGKVWVSGKKGLYQAVPNGYSLLCGYQKSDATPRYPKVYPLGRRYAERYPLGQRTLDSSFKRVNPANGLSRKTKAFAAYTRIKIAIAIWYRLIVIRVSFKSIQRNEFSYHSQLQF